MFWNPQIFGARRDVGAGLMSPPAQSGMGKDQEYDIGGFRGGQKSLPWSPPVAMSGGGFQWPNQIRMGPMPMPGGGFQWPPPHQPGQVSPMPMPGPSPNKPWQVQPSKPAQLPGRGGGYGNTTKPGGGYGPHPGQPPSHPQTGPVASPQAPPQAPAPPSWSGFDFGGRTQVHEHQSPWTQKFYAQQQANQAPPPPAPPVKPPQLSDSAQGPGYGGFGDHVPGGNMGPYGGRKPGTSPGGRPMNPSMGGSPPIYQPNKPQVRPMSNRVKLQQQRKRNQANQTPPFMPGAYF